MILRPEVDKPQSRVRLSVLLGLLGAIVAVAATMHTPPTMREPVVVRSPQAELAAAHCTALDVEQRTRDPQMPDVERVVCFAVAGKIDRARKLLQSLAEPDRNQAIAMVFSVAHPIADSGDDRSAGPIMELVAEFSPDNYMAVFHAGMAEFALGQDDAARIQLQRFLTMYSMTDVWHQRAKTALAAIEAHVPLDQREAHFPE